MVRRLGLIDRKLSDLRRRGTPDLLTLGGIDVLVNNAGISGPTAPVEDMDPDAWDTVMSVNLSR